MNKWIQLILASGALVTALIITPQPAKAMCSSIYMELDAERECRVYCALQGCSYSFDPQWGLCSCF